MLITQTQSLPREEHHTETPAELERFRGERQRGSLGGILRFIHSTELNEHEFLPCPRLSTRHWNGLTVDLWEVEIREKERVMRIRKAQEKMDAFNVEPVRYGS